MAIGQRFEDPAMFEVREETAQALFDAQQKRAQGRLRLDVSSRMFPRNVEEPLDLQSARQAIGERVVEMAYGAAAEAVALGSAREGFQPDAVPPAPGRDHLLRLMPSRDAFEDFVERRLREWLGLDRRKENYRQAFTLLAKDFYAWCQSDDAGCDFVVDTKQGTLAIQCKPQQPRLSELRAADQIWTPTVEK